MSEQHEPQSRPTGTAEAYERLRPLLFSIAYRMLASAAEAEDVVQEAFLRFHEAERAGDQIASPRAYLSTVTTRLAIDHLRAARTRRETYVGEWLPEPILTATDDAFGRAETADSLSMAFLLLLERLSPVERAVFLLREVFGYEYAEIAGIIGKSEANTRQLMVRARQRIRNGRPRFEASREQRWRLARRFLAAAQDGDTKGLTDLLAADVVLYGDGGGKAPAVREPMHGRDRVARLLAGLTRQASRLDADLDIVEVNGQPGIIGRDHEGAVLGVLTLDIADGQIQVIRSVVNPDKLTHLGRPAASYLG